jgi:RimJ/RimL family protein N-acetyltransferase
VFEELSGVRLELRCDARNDRSRHVAERLGFALEGRLRNEARDPSGQLRDTLVYALIPEDYGRLRVEWWPTK